MAKDLPCLLFLLGRKMLPRLHAVEHAQLLLRRQVGKMLQALPKLLLSFRGQAAEGGIVLEFALLFRRG